MKVILKQDIKGQGKKGDIIKVNDGYARNYLFPKNLAEDANAANLNSINMRKDAEKFHQEEERKKALELAEKISQTALSLVVKCGTSGKVFGSITSKEIAENLNLKGIEIDKKKIVLKEPIKQAGVYTIEIKIYPEITGKLILTVESVII